MRGCDDKLSQILKEVHEQSGRLQAIGNQVTYIEERVRKLEAKSSLWGAVGGALAAIITQLLGGC